MKHRTFGITVWALVSLSNAAGVRAQTLDRGEIRGTVRDESGAVLPDVAVTLRDVNTGFERALRTNSAGQWSGVLLSVGEYVVTAERAGFATTRSNAVALRVGQSLVVNLVLKVTAQETVEVTGVSNEAVSGTSTVLEARAITNLPINGRDYRDFALLAPTATPTTGTRGTFRVGGQPGDYLALHVDGADFTNNFFGEFFGSIEQSNFTVPLEAVQEFRVSAGGFGAEFGRSNGGLVNVVTRSGANKRHGSLAYFLRDKELTSDDAFGNPPTGLRRHQFGGSLGGPLKTDRAFFFLAADLQRQTTPVTVRFSRPVSGIAVPELGIADLASLEGQFPREQDVTTVLAKVDVALSRTHRLSTRANYTRANGTNIAGGGLILSRATSNLESFKNAGTSVVMSLSSTLGSRLFSEFKAQFSRETRPRSAQGAGPQVQINDTGTFGRSQALPATQDMNRYQVSGNLSYLAGKHTLKFGADYDAFNMRNNFFALSAGGAYTFPTLEAFRARTPSLYSQHFGLGGLDSTEAALLDSFWQKEVSFYVQDQWRPSARLTLGYGLRYDAQLNPAPVAGIAGTRVAIGEPEGNQVTFGPVPQGIPDDTNNVSPRAEISYDVRGDGSTLVKAGFGLYFGRTPMIYFPVRGSGTIETTIFAPPFLFAGLRFPAVLPSAIAPGSALERLVPRPSILYVDPDFQNPRVFNATLSVTQRLGPDWNVQLGYLFSDSKNLRIGGFRSTFFDRNLAPPTQFDSFGRGINILGAGRPDTTINQANALTSFGRGRYNALVVDVRREFRRGWQAYLSYTLAKAKGNGATERDTESFFGPSDPFNLDADYGLSELDVRHALRAYVQAELPYQFFVASTWTASSGLVFPVYGSVDVNNDGVRNNGLNPDRPTQGGQLLERFPFHQPSRFNWDLRVGKGFKIAGAGTLQLLVEVFNLLNTDNTFPDPATNAILGTPNFRVHNRTLGPRIVQLGARFDF